MRIKTANRTIMETIVIKYAEAYFVSIIYYYTEHVRGERPDEVALIAVVLASDLSKLCSRSADTS